MFAKTIIVLGGSALLVNSEAPADGRAILSITPRGGLQIASVGSGSDSVDVRSIPSLLSASLQGRTRRLTEADSKVEACLGNEVAVETMATLGIQSVNTASEVCEASLEQLCEYLESASALLEFDVLCEPNFVLRLESPEVSAVTVDAVRGKVTARGVRNYVNDDLANYQYNLDVIEIVDAWKAVAALGRPVREVVVAVIDSGVDYSHEDLRNKMVAGKNCQLGYNFVDDNADPKDVRGHGTHCAGILGAQTNNKVGIAGIADVQILALRVFGADGWGDIRLALKALDFAVEFGADISSHSYTSPQYSATMMRGIKKAGEKGHLVIAAAGNEGKDISVEKRYPCAYTAELPDMICVGSTSGKFLSDRLAVHSNYAPYVDIAAPGVDIPSTYPGGRYVHMSGTSMATPHVAGVAGLLAYMGLSASDIKKTLVSSVDEIQGFSFVEFGRLNANKAAVAAHTYPTVEPRPMRSVGGEECKNYDKNASGHISAVSAVLLCFVAGVLV